MDYTALKCIKSRKIVLVPPFSAAASPFPVPIQNRTPQTQATTDEGFKYQEYLPATYSTSRSGPFLHVNQGNISAAIQQDMLVPKLNDVHEYLWFCKKLPETLPLHEHVMEKRQIAVTEQVDLHLVCPTRRIFIKPLPLYLFCHEFWIAHICADTKLYMCCTGFLLSYAWRIRHESDLAIAIEHRLVPKDLTWKAWTAFVSSFLAHMKANGGPSKCVNKRYQYGELKLTRLNVVYRYAPEVPGLRGYVSGYGQASMFFKRNFAWMGLGFLYLVAILTSMQVGLAATPLKDNASFNWASYVFAVFCILLPVTIVAIHLLRHVAGLIWFSAGMMRKIQNGSEDEQQSV